MKHNQTVIVCFDGKIVRGVYGKVLSSTQYKFSVEFTYFGEYQVQTFRKERNSRKKLPSMLELLLSVDTSDLPKDRTQVLLLLFQ